MDLASVTVPETPDQCLAEVATPLSGTVSIYPLAISSVAVPGYSPPDLYLQAVSLRI
jgi:hypothetical protein